MSGPPLLYRTMYAFGDSLSDAGNLSISTTLIGATPASPPYYERAYGFLVSGTVFSNGPVWTQDLASSLSLGVLAPSLDGGNDFAFGGAETGSTPQNAKDPTLAAISLPSQLQQFQAGVFDPPSDALYTLSIGGNDILAVLADTSLSAAQQTADINDAVANEVSFIDSLIADGARSLAVLNVPDLGKTPSVTQGLANGSGTPSASFDALASSLTSQYNSALAAQLGGVANAHVALVDAYQLIDDAVADPAAYGLTNVTDPVWSGNYSSSGSGTLAATGSAQNQYLFFDHLHPTETGQMALATLAEADLVAAASGVETISATNAGQVVSLTGGQNIVFATTPISVDQIGGTNTIISGVGALTVSGLGGTSLIYDSGGGSLILEAPSSVYVSSPASQTTTIGATQFGDDTIYAGGKLLYDGLYGRSSVLVGGSGAMTVVAASNETVFSGTGGGVYEPGRSSFFLFGGGGADTVSSGSASPTLWGNTNERLVAQGTAAHGIFVAYGTNDSIDAATAGGHDSFIAVNEALPAAGGSFTGNTTLVASAAGNDTLALFNEDGVPIAHTISVENWRSGDVLYLDNYEASDQTAAAAVLAAGVANGASFTLSDKTTITFVAARSG